jgi:hypothetical protein
MALNQFDMIEAGIGTVPLVRIEMATGAAFRAAGWREGIACRKMRLADERCRVARVAQLPCESGVRKRIAEIDAIVSDAVGQRQLTGQYRCARGLSNMTGTDAR